MGIRNIRLRLIFRMRNVHNITLHVPIWIYWYLQISFYFKQVQSRPGWYNSKVRVYSILFLESSRIILFSCVRYLDFDIVRITFEEVPPVLNLFFIVFLTVLCTQYVISHILELFYSIFVRFYYSRWVEMAMRECSSMRAESWELTSYILQYEITVILTAPVTTIWRFFFIFYFNELYSHYITSSTKSFMESYILFVLLRTKLIERCKMKILERIVKLDGAVEVRKTYVMQGKGNSMWIIS